MLKPELVTTPEALARVCGSLMNEPVIAVDTEFFWERTFYPILGLVQLASAEGACFLIDTVALADIRALAPVLESRAVVKILHDAPQDLGILARAAEAAPRTIFDTRLAAGFAGFDSTCSLQNLLKQVLEIEISKAETRSNWLKRPLSESQLTYAALDVLHLPALREKLIEHCRDDGVRSWMAEDNALLDSPETFAERDPREMFRRIRASARFNAAQLAVLRELAAWREIKARQRDLPRNRILPDATLADLARAMPRDRAGIDRAAGLPRTLPAPVATELLHLIRCGAECPDGERPQPDPASVTAVNDLKARTRNLLDLIGRECAKHGVDPALVASRSDAEAYILHCETGANFPDLKLTRGWRADLLRRLAPHP